MAMRVQGGKLVNVPPAESAGRIRKANRNLMEARSLVSGAIGELTRAGVPYGSAILNDLQRASGILELWDRRTQRLETE